MFNSRIFTGWFVGMLCLWLVLFTRYNDLTFLAEHWYYPAIMVLGAFVAGLTPEGGGAVAFPVLNIFLSVDRTMARDFSLMIQSIGMTSASIYILSNRNNNLRDYKPLLAFIPVCFVGFVAGMLLLQSLPVYIIQALFLSLITTFAIAYVWSDHRGDRPRLHLSGWRDRALLVLILVVGGLFASLFGTGADIVVYTLLVTRFRMNEKVATHMSIMLMAAISILGYAYRHFYDAGLTEYQVRTWLCAYPVVLFMAPFGAYILSRINVEWMLRGIVVLNIAQLAYFNLNNPSWAKAIWSGVFCVVLMAIFSLTLSRISRRKAADQAAVQQA
ncbi:permease [Niveispirillum lacus]|uniref:Probable membrane transporter protein n=1 Tax=Niveispirillum lacus TaxID=1981099 RepID=A0A255YZ51_9PROT|nr:sulfite exporter TauE/SafE family protein [Niveispirillum lacus]OYQ34523.1 permease [Niveispirillum lacus]